MAKRNTKRIKLEDLFIWKRPLAILDHNRDEVLTVYQRVVTDRELEQARLQAIRESHSTRKALRDESTAEHAALMENMANYGKEDFISILLLDDLENIQEEAKRRVRTQFPKNPGGKASLEEIETYEIAVDEYNSKVENELNEKLAEVTKAQREKYDAMADGEIRDKVLRALENQVCRNIMATTFNELTAFYGTYEDENYKTHYFQSFDDFREVAHEVKLQLVRGYQKLTVGRDDLKN